MAYFCVAELLANVSRHSVASRTAVRIDGDRTQTLLTVPNY
jgi:signal transduction histidine kinase